MCNVKIKVVVFFFLLKVIGGGAWQVNQVDTDGNTPLHLAAASAFVSVSGMHIHTMLIFKSLQPKVAC